MDQLFCFGVFSVDCSCWRRRKTVVRSLLRLPAFRLLIVLLKMSFVLKRKLLVRNDYVYVIYWLVDCWSFIYLFAYFWEQQSFLQVWVNGNKLCSAVLMALLLLNTSSMSHTYMMHSLQIISVCGSCTEFRNRKPYKCYNLAWHVTHGPVSRSEGQSLQGQLYFIGVKMTATAFLCATAYML